MEKKQASTKPMWSFCVCSVLISHGRGSEILRARSYSWKFDPELAPLSWKPPKTWESMIFHLNSEVDSVVCHWTLTTAPTFFLSRWLPIQGLFLSQPIFTKGLLKSLIIFWVTEVVSKSTKWSGLDGWANNASISSHFPLYFSPKKGRQQILRTKTWKCKHLASCSSLQIQHIRRLASGVPACQPSAARHTKAMGISTE